MKIVVYSKPSCVQCRYTKQEMDRLGLIYEAIDVTKDREAASDARRLGRQHGLNFPVVVVSYAHGNGQEIWAGFKVEKIRGLIK